MLIEPTESESKASLDLFIMTLRDLAFAAQAGERDRFSLLRFMRRAAGSTRRARRASLCWVGRSLPRSKGE